MFGFGVPELIVLVVVIGIPVAIVYFIRRSSAKDAEAPAEGSPPVSNGRRLANFIVDILLFRIAVILALVPFVNTDFVQYVANNGLVDWLFGLSLLFLYYAVFETLFQRTPAKFITGTKVVMLDGSKPDAGAIIARTLSRLVPFEPFSGRKGAWWHDRWSKTRVVKA